MLKAIWRYTKVFKGVKMPWILLLIFVALSVINTNVEVESVTLTASIIDGTQNSVNTDLLVRYIVYIVLSGILTIATTYISGLAYQKINLGVRLRMWNKMMRLPTRFYDGDSANGLVTRITTDADSACYFFQVLIGIGTTIYAGIVAFLQLYNYQPSMAFVSLGIIPLMVGVALLYGWLTYRTGAETRNRLAKTMSYLAERVTGMRLIKSFSTQEEENKKADRLFRKQCNADIKLSLTAMVQYAGMELIGCISIVIAFGYGGYLVTTGEMSIGKLIGFYSLSSLLSVRVVGLFTYFSTLAQNAGVMQKIGTVLELPNEKSEGHEMDVEDADIHVDHVNFSYGTQPVLKDLTVTIPKGKVTAIIGANGAGKTTLFKLLERMYEPDSGAIRFGDTDIEEFSLPSWRKSFAIVAQDKPLLSGTVRENILYGVERKVSEEELVKVAKMANAYDFIMETPGGFDAQVGPGGSNFSGGQQQCIVIARAMMRNPDYLLLDEATSNLDVKSEQLVTAALQNLMKGRTTVLIAHNYSATQFADQVIVMRGGQIEDCGTPQELMERSEYYQTFARKGEKAS